MKNIFYTTKLGRWLKRRYTDILFWIFFPLLLVSVPASIITKAYWWVLLALISVMMLMVCINEDAKSW